MITTSIPTPATRRAATLRIGGAGLVTLALVFATDAVMAAPACADHHVVRQQLERHHGEVPIAIGLADGGQVIEVFASKSWTVVMTRPDGKSCITAAGHDWEAIAEMPTGPEV